MTDNKQKIPIWKWRDAIRDADVPAYTKLLCYTISNFLNNASEQCWPSVEVLMRQSGMSNKTVAMHTKVAVKAGLLSIERRNGKDGRYKKTIFKPCFTAAAAIAQQHDSSAAQVKEVHAAPCEAASSGPCEGGSSGPREPDDMNHVKEVHANSPIVRIAQAAACSSASDFDSTVVSLSDDADLIRRRLEPFGEHGPDWARDLAQFLNVKVPKAVDHMEKAARTYGHFNVLEAIREAVATSNVKSPNGLFGSILTRLQSQHGKRDQMPRPQEAPKVQMLPMSQRGFATC